ncbi:MAG TPA: hypothetical protein VF637_19050, partial [Sphingomicrobium sp.]
MANLLRHQHRWIFCVVAMAMWVAWGWPLLEALTTGAMFRRSPVSALWLVPYAVFGAAVLGAMLLKQRTN